MKNFAVIFDMDGVIVDTNAFHKEAIHQFCNTYGFSLTEEQLKTSVYGRTNKDWLTNLFGKLPDADLQKYAFEKEELFRNIYKPYIKPVKGLENFLNLLVQHKIPTAIATSAPTENVDFVLSHTGLGNYFETILDERFVSNGKPDPEIYLKTAQALTLPNDRCIVIEDSISGITAGLRAGSKVIGITTTHTPEEMSMASHIIHDFDDLTLEDLLKLV
jgi:HAD superfamily hydrolase (TIGR01509 family)